MENSETDKNSQPLGDEELFGVILVAVAALPAAAWGLAPFAARWRLLHPHAAFGWKRCAVFAGTLVALAMLTYTAACSIIVTLWSSPGTWKLLWSWLAWSVAGIPLMPFAAIGAVTAMGRRLEGLPEKRRKAWKAGHNHAVEYRARRLLK